MILGLLDLVAAKYLISIASREQVAQIRGKPIYAITDVTLIPLSSHAEAEKAISAAIKSRGKAPAGDESEDSDDEDDTETASINEESHAEEGAALEAPKSGLVKRGTNVVKNVVQDRGKYGRFAEKWFSKGGWTASGRRRQGMDEEAREELTPEQQKEANKALPEGEKVDTALEQASDAQKEEKDEEDDSNEQQKLPPKSNVETLTPRILRSARLYFSSKSFFFSYDHDISTSLAKQSSSNSALPLWKRFDEIFFWNHSLLRPFIDAGQSGLTLPLLQGFVGQRAFSIAQSEDGDGHAVAEATDKPEEVIAAQKDATSEPKKRDFLVTIISRRSTKRAGLRYLRRGIDEDGNVANYVETEQILSSQTWDPAQKLYSLVQIRGSIPLFFSQTPYSFKPIPVLFGSETTNHVAFKKHFASVAERYGQVQVASLVDKTGTEAAVGESYESTAKWMNDLGGVNGSKIGFEWFYFHKECGGMRFENVSKLLTTLEGSLRSHGWTVRQNDKDVRQQHGVLRTNCMDCLDRTNVTQSSVGGWALQQQLAEEGLIIDLQSDPKTFWFNSLWADNGDAISKQYAGTSALKGDFTRTRKRNWTGALSDLSLSLNRYYNNIFGDYFLQTCIDFYLGHVGPGVFDEFETNMMSQDYALDMRRVRQDAIDTCVKIVLEDPKEDLLAGWTLSCPQQANTLRSLPFEECVLLLTDAALYFCRFDWDTEKVGSFERLDLEDVTEIWRGAYVTSTLGPTHMDKAKNVGFALRYSTKGKAVVRTNTRSMNNEKIVDDENDSKEEAEKQQTAEKDESRLLAFKALPPKSSATRRASRQQATDLNEQDSVQHICDEVQKAIVRARRMDHLELDKAPAVEEKDVVSLADARKATGYMESLGYSLKRLVWS